MIKSINSMNIHGNELPKIEELHKTITDITINGDVTDYTELKKYENLMRLETYISSNLGILTLRNVLNEMKYFDSLSIIVTNEVNFELFGNSNKIDSLFIKSSEYCAFKGKRILTREDIDYTISLDISLFKDWKKLRFLSVQFPKVENLNILKEVNTIKHLELYESCFKNFDGISEFDNLETLRILQLGEQPILSEEEVKQINQKLPYTNIISTYSTDDEKRDYSYYLFDPDELVLD